MIGRLRVHFLPMFHRFLRSSILGAGVAAVGASHVFAFSKLPTVAPETLLTVNKDGPAGEVVLTWTATTGPYTVSRNTNPNFSGTTAAQIIASGIVGAEFRDSVLNDGITYYYRVEDANAPPRIYSASVSSGTPGTAITLTGVGFDPAGPADNEILIGGTPAGIIAVSSTALTYTTPPSLTGFVIVRNKNGVGVGQLHYVVATGVSIG